MDDDRILIEEARLLAQRLERVSVDSLLARRSSGQRGELLKWIEQLESIYFKHGEIQLTPAELHRIRSLMEACYKLLEKAARERLR